MSKWRIYGSYLNGRDRWVFEAEDFQVNGSMLTATGSFQRKRFLIRVQIPLSSVIYVEEVREARVRRARRTVSKQVALPAAVPEAASGEKRRGRPRKAATA